MFFLFTSPFLVLEDFSVFKVNEFFLEEASEFVFIIYFLLFSISDGGFFIDFLQELFRFLFGFFDFELEFLQGLVALSLELRDECIIFSLLIG